MASPITIADAIAAIQEEIAQGRLQLDRDIYSNIQLPNYRDITYPTSVGQNTGYLPQGYPGGYGGLPTFGALTGVANQFGNAVGNDPRWAQLGIHTGDLTLGGQAQRLAEDAQRAQQQEFEQRLGFDQYNSNQARFNDFTDQSNKDRQYALEINADPNTVVAGTILPDWLQPHAEWARQFASQNGGRLPTSQDLRTALGGYGQAPAPGLPVKDTAVQQLNTDYAALKQQLGQDLSYNDPRLVALYQKDLGEDPATAQRQALAVSDWSRAHPGQVPDLATQTGLYNTPAPQQQAAEDPNARQQIQGGAMRQYGGSATMASPQAMAAMGLGQQPGVGGMGPLGGVNYGGSGVTAGIGAGQAMSLDQRRLIEQGRATDLQTQLAQNAQRLQALQQESQLRADPFALARYRYGLGQGGQSGLVGAIGGQGVLPSQEGGYGRAPGAPSLANQQREMAGMPTFGQGQANRDLAALPALNQLNARNYLRSGAQGQQYVNSAYRAAGLAGTDQDVQEAAQRALPQFARRGVPTFGRAA